MSDYIPFQDRVKAIIAQRERVKAIIAQRERDEAVAALGGVVALQAQAAAQQAAFDDSEFGKVWREIDAQQAGPVDDPKSYLVSVETEQLVTQSVIEVAELTPEEFSEWFDIDNYDDKYTWLIKRDALIESSRQLHKVRETLSIMYDVSEEHHDGHSVWNVPACEADIKDES